MAEDDSPAAKRGLGGEKKPTINDIARLAGVSKKTVSRVINQSPFVKDETRERINAIIAETGFSPDPQARGLAFRRSFLIGLVYDNPNPQYVVNMQQGILDGLRGSGHELVVHPCVRGSPSFLDDMRVFVERQKLYGVVLTPSVSEDAKAASLLDEIGCKYVRIASVPLADDEHMIVTHDRVGTAAAAEHLAELGHKRIALITGQRSFRSAAERRKGFEQGLAKYKLKLQPKYVARGAYTFESGRECAQALIALDPRPTAIFASNDEMAAGALQAVRMAGLRTPEDISIVGYDDFEIASRVWPRLTTVHTPTRHFGRLAALKLLRGLDVSEESGELRPTLVVRESSGPPAG